MGIESIDKGQYDAAKVLGFTSYKTFIRIILPQVIKIVMPSIANEVITLIKDTALVYIVGLGELFGLWRAKLQSNRDASPPYALGFSRRNIFGFNSNVGGNF